MRLTLSLLVGLCCLALGTVGCSGSKGGSDAGQSDASTGMDAGDAGGMMQHPDAGGDGGSGGDAMPTQCEHFSCTDNSHCQVNEAGAPYCQCDDGYQPFTIASDAGAVLVCQKPKCGSTPAQSPCDANATCSASPDNASYTCTCNTGYYGDGMTCMVDHCAPMNDSHGVTHDGVCDPNATCVNTMVNQDGFKCTCDPGYLGDGMTCYLDVCNINNGGCDQHATCTNNKGTATCACQDGFTGDGMTCTDKNECTDGTAMCPDHSTCNNTPGSFYCQCNNGYQMNGNACVYVSPCINNPCPANSLCTDNMDGTSSCNCKAGYALNTANMPETCDDVDECALHTDNCDASMYTCVNTVGSFTCACKSGSVGDPTNGCRSGYANTPPALGDAFSCAVATDHTMWCWGDDNVGQVGDGQFGMPSALNPNQGPIPPFKAPTQTISDGNWTWVKAGSDYACAGKTDGSLWCWGDNFIGNIGDGADWGYNDDPTLPPVVTPLQVNDWTDVLTAAAGQGQTCAIRGSLPAGGTLWCWGEDDVGQLGDGKTVPTADPPNQTPHHPQMNAPERIGMDSNWVQVAAGTYHTCGLKADHTLWCWGRNDEGELGLGDASTSIMQQLTPAQVVAPLGSMSSVQWTAVAAGAYQTCGIAGGQLYCWGTNLQGEQGNCDTEGKLFNGTPIQEQQKFTDWVEVSVGAYEACGTRSDGSAWCWGDDYFGQIGVNSMGDMACKPYQVSPVQAASGSPETWLHVTAGNLFTAAVASDNSLWTWGKDDAYQLGLGTTGVGEEIIPQQTH